MIFIGKSSENVVLRWISFILFFVLSWIISTNGRFDLFGLKAKFSLLFFLPAGKMWGFLPGLLVAGAAGAGAYGQEHWVTSTFTSLALYSVALGLAGRGFMLAEGVALYHMTTLAIILATPNELAPASAEIMRVFLYLRSATIDIMLAGAIDIFFSHFKKVDGIHSWIKQPYRSLNTISRCSTNFTLALLLTAGLAWEASRLQAVRQAYRADLSRAFQNAVSPMTEKGDRSLNTMVGDKELLITKVPSGVDPQLFAKQVFPEACRAPTIRKAGEHSDRHAFDVMLWPCTIESVKASSGGAQVETKLVVNATNIANAESQRLLHGLMVLGFLLGFCGLYINSVRQMIRQCLTMTKETLQKFGTPNLALPGPLPISDFQKVVDTFVLSNNEYIETLSERNSLSNAIKELERTIDLKFISNIYFDNKAGTIRFERISLDGEKLTCLINIHPGDVSLFNQFDGMGEVVIEFRAAEQEEATQLLMVQGSAGVLQWTSGIMITIHQPKRMREFLRHHARLVDLGGMASAICHELKQPLFTIALAAQSIPLLLNDTSEDHTKLIERSQRIGEQVTRAQEIIDRIASYGRISLGQNEATTPLEAFNSACSLLGVLLEANGIKTNVQCEDSGTVRVSRIALEQVMVNAVQNSIDAIVEARTRYGRTDAGLITFDCTTNDTHLIARIMDDGAGLQVPMASALFEPFFTTKSNKGGSGLGLFVAKQIIIEAKGQIELRQKEPHGTILEIRLPLVSQHVEGTSAQPSANGIPC